MNKTDAMILHFVWSLVRPTVKEFLDEVQEILAEKLKACPQCNGLLVDSKKDFCENCNGLGVVANDG